MYSDLPLNFEDATLARWIHTEENYNQLCWVYPQGCWDDDWPRYVYIPYDSYFEVV